MKNILFLILLALSTGLFSCRKSTITPSKLKIQDTLSDSAFFKIQVVNINDSLPITAWSGRSETLVLFDHAYHLFFINGEDSAAPGIPGLNSPVLNLMSITSDGVAVLTDAIPYKVGVTVPLRLTVASSGPYILKAYYLRWFPADIHIWCKDNLLKDSVDLRKGNYSFTVDRSDPNQYGTNRFAISLGPK